MKVTRYTRRDFFVGLATSLPALGLVKNSFGLAEPQGDRNGILHDCESIHQEVVFRAPRKRVYEALTDEKKFSKTTVFVLKRGSTKNSKEVGGSFSIFGGVITERHIELVPDERIVQAWREKDWTPGLYSIVRFQLDDQEPSTKLVFYHTGSPRGAP